MEVVVTTEAVRCAKLQSNRHHQQTNNTQLYVYSLVFLDVGDCLLGCRQTMTNILKIIELYYYYYYYCYYYYYYFFYLGRYIPEVEKNLLLLLLLLLL